MQKIGIMTWFSYNNYGTVLQAYSLLNKIQDLGYCAEIINYKPKIRKTLIFDINCKFLINKLLIRKYKRNCKNYIDVDILFNNFRNEKLILSDECDTFISLKNEADKCFKIICGSDQIWNPNLFDKHYFLDFVQNGSKKISYAPSLGVDNISNNIFKKVLNDLLHNFKNISVREEDGASIIKNIIKRDVETVLDPTLLLSPKEWIQKMNLKKTDDRYILCYFLGNNRKYIKIARRMSKLLNLPLKIIPTNDLCLKFSNDERILKCGPEQFVQSIYNASYVITDSYHGLVFSINFNKPFTALKRFKNDKYSQNVRIFNILNKFQLSNHLYAGELKLDNFNYESINNILDFERKRSIKYLESCLKQENDNEISGITNNCTGCGMCASVCPTRCISISKNENGFYYYNINKNKCINCGICRKVCSQCNNNASNIENQKLFSAYSKDSFVLKTSSSGGVAYELARYAVRNDIPVIGCIYNFDKNRAEHIVVKTEQELIKFSGSKYLQSYTVNAFKQIVTMEKGLIFGTPCQIASIDNYLRLLRKRNNFILVDLICHGVPSYLVWDEIIKKYKNIHSIKFRDKKYGWGKFLTINSHKVNKNLFYDFFESGIIYNECCYDCNYREKIPSDIRLGDYWGKESKKGVSKIVVNGKKGLEYFNLVKEYLIYNKENINTFFENQQRKNVVLPKSRYYLLNEFKSNKYNLKNLSSKYCKKIVRDANYRKRFYKLYSKIKKILNMERLKKN